MAKNSVRDFDATAANNTDIQSVDIAENCAPSGINNAIRELMADVKDVSTGTVALESPQADSMTVTGDLTVDTNTLYVDSTNNRVGVGTASPTQVLTVKTATDANLVALNDSGVRLQATNDAGTSLDTMKIAGNPLIFLGTGGTESARLDSSNNFLVGTTTLSTTTDGHELRADGKLVSSTSGAAVAYFNRNTDDGQIIRLDKDGTTVGSIKSYNGSFLQIESAGNQSGLLFGTTAYYPVKNGSLDNGNIDIGNGSNRFKDLYLGGSVYADKVGIGTSTISGKLTVAGDDAFEAITLRDNTSSANMFSITCAEYSGSGGNPNKFSAINSSAISFELGGLERMRLSHTSNALSIGKTTFGTSGQGFTVYGNTAPQCYFNKSQSGAVNGVLFYHANSYVGGLNYNNTNTSLATSSDERLKDNIENSDDAGAKIDAMQVRQFDWKSTGEHQEYGFVAQELEPVFAHAVHTDKEGDYKSVDYACLVPMLVKEIQSLRQRITDLENA